MTNYTAVHRSPRRLHPPRSRAGRFVAGVVTVALALLIGAAAALFVGKAPIHGGAQAGQFAPYWEPTPAASVVSSTDMTCTVARKVDGSLDLNVTSAFPGGSCTIAGTAYLKAGDAQDGKIVGVDLNLPEDWTATLRPSDCGATLVRGTGRAVQFTVAMGENAVNGSSTFDNDGLLVAPVSSGAPLQCTPAA